jgi:Zn-dependent protease
MGGAIRLFKVAGIQVSLHFSWFLVAAYQLTSRHHGYSSNAWAAIEYLMLFAIVLLHEFGHALACRQTGGQANFIMLWPLGGVAFVHPPPRPGAQLWSIAAGPLVNLVLLPILLLAQVFALALNWPLQFPDAYRLLLMTGYINGALLIFNLLPIYPLDGGQILRSLLWFPFGRIRSLQVASVTGFIGSGLVVLYAIYVQSIWIGVMAFFLISQAMAGWRQAQALTLDDEETRRTHAEAERPPVI